MVVKLEKARHNLHLWFEHGVISYGSQTFKKGSVFISRFEHGVISYGSQTAGGGGIVVPNV